MRGCCPALPGVAPGDLLGLGSFVLSLGVVGWVASVPALSVCVLLVSWMMSSFLAWGCAAVLVLGVVGAFVTSLSGLVSRCGVFC